MWQGTAPIRLPVRWGRSRQASASFLWASRAPTRDFVPGGRPAKIVVPTVCLRALLGRFGKTGSAFARLRAFGASAGLGEFPPFLGSSTVEHPAVNRRVAGSNPARGANFLNNFACVCVTHPVL